MRYGMLIDLRKCVGCNACTLACKNSNGTPAGISYHSILKYEVGKYPTAKKKFIPMPCQHCKDAPCLKFCPSGATIRREDGIVEIINSECFGCRGCIAACPYDKRQFIWDVNKYYDEDTEYETKRYAKFQKGTVVKCNFCLGRLQEGKNTACTDTCPTKCRTFGDLDDPNSELSKKLVAENARPFREDLETDPSVYYIFG